MYTKEILSKHPFFEELLKVEDLDGILDSLTGVLSRQYIIEYVNYLIDNNIPFSLAMLDLDNFKFINDTYGHKVGDGVLENVSRDLIRYLEDYGVAGRFGGDEFLIVNLRDLEYDEKKQFFHYLYANFNVLRKNVNLKTCDPFITGTIGCATFPTDAFNYDELFHLIDKALYRGKTKGRNCYIIYLESKHKNIEIKELSKHGLYTTFYNLSKEFDSTLSIYDKLKRMLNVLSEDMRISNLYYCGRDNIIKDALDKCEPAYIADIDDLMSEDIKATNELNDLSLICPDFYYYLTEKDMESILVVRISMGNEHYGYIFCAEPHNRRLWQEDDKAILFSIARMLAGFIKASGRKI